MRGKPDRVAICPFKCVRACASVGAAANAAVVTRVLKGSVSQELGVFAVVLNLVLSIVIPLSGFPSASIA